MSHESISNILDIRGYFVITDIIDMYAWPGNSHLLADNLHTASRLTGTVGRSTQIMLTRLHFAHSGKCYDQNIYYPYRSF